MDPEKFPPFMPDHKAKILVMGWIKENGVKKVLHKTNFKLTLERSYKINGKRWKNLLCCFGFNKLITVLKVNVDLSVTTILLCMICYFGNCGCLVRFGWHEPEFDLKLIEYIECDLNCVERHKYLTIYLLKIDVSLFVCLSIYRSLDQKS